MLAISERAVAKHRTVYQLKITLQGIRPPIWRRFQVWDDVTLAKLSDVLQIVMSWEDCHLHDFVIDRRRYSVPDFDGDGYGRDVSDERLTRLNEVVQQVGSHFEYRYDFGDDWSHDLLLEAILLPEPAVDYPRCIAGARATPPEDIGGVFGYLEYLEAIGDPSHEEHENMLDWRGPFDAEAFSATTVNQILKKKFRVRKPTAKSGARAVGSDSIQ